MTTRQRMMTLKGILGGGAAGITLPYTFTPPVSGAWAAPWVAPTWSANANTPTLGAELLTDPGLEGTYTGGKCDAMSTLSTPTMSQSADVHGGSKAQSFTATAQNDALYQSITPLAQRWYQFSFWSKRTAGSSNNIWPNVYQGGSSPSVNNYANPVASATYTQKFITKRTANTGAMFAYPALENGTSGFETIIFDDISLKLIDTASMFATIETGAANMVVKTKWGWTNRDGLCGVIAKANAGMTDFLIAYYFPISAAFTYCVLDKCVNGTYTNLIADWSNAGGAGSGATPANTEWLEIRVNGTTVQLFHNDIQIGTDKTVNDATITPNTLAGAFSSGGGSLLASFFVSEP